MGTQKETLDSDASFRHRLYSIIFYVAAVYNVAFGAWTCIWPEAFFELFRMAPPRYPEIWQCLGMVVGVYGVAYAYAAVYPDRGRPLIAIGLLGKILGPIGWVLSAGGEQWPTRTFTLIAFNDLIWWVPFALYLLEGWKSSWRLRAAAPWLCALLNAAAAVALALFLRQGTPVVANLEDRASYIADHSIRWRLGWLLWMAAAVSLASLYAWWAAHLPNKSIGIAAWLIGAAGVPFDFLIESLFVGWLPADMDGIQRASVPMTGGIANGLYTIAGVILTISTPSIRGRYLFWAWAVWSSGILLSIASFAGSLHVVAVSTAALMVLFCPWAALLGLHLARIGNPLNRASDPCV
jgi:hypothetical protein